MTEHSSKKMAVKNINKSLEIVDKALLETKKIEEAEATRIKKEKTAELLKRGGIEQDFFEDNFYFRILLKTIYLESNKKSYPTEITRSLFKISEGEDITKTSEYNKVLRYLRKWEKVKILKKSSEKLQHNLSYYQVQYDEVVKRILKRVHYRSNQWTEEASKGLKYKDNEYIIAIVKLYYYFLAIESYNFTRFGFNASIDKFITYLFEQIDSDAESIINNKKREILKVKDIVYELRDASFNKGMERYKDKDNKLYHFFKFLNVLAQLYYDFDVPKRRCKLVIPDIVDFIKIKYEPDFYNTKDDISKTWLDDIKDLEKKPINKYRFKY